MPPAPVNSEENLSRFVTSKQYYRPSNNTIKWNAFMPNRNRETSVFRTYELSDDEIWALGERHITKDVWNIGNQGLFSCCLLEYLLK